MVQIHFLVRNCWANVDFSIQSAKPKVRLIRIPRVSDSHDSKQIVEENDIFILSLPGQNVMYDTCRDQELMGNETINFQFKGLCEMIILILVRHYFFFFKQHFSILYALPQHLKMVVSRVSRRVQFKQNTVVLNNRIARTYLQWTICDVSCSGVQWT